MSEDVAAGFGGHQRHAALSPCGVARPIVLNRGAESVKIGAVRPPPPVMARESIRSPAPPRWGRAARVLVVAPQPFYEDRGTPIAVRQVVEALSQIGHSIDVLTYPVGRAVAIPRVSVLRSANPLRIRSVPVGFSIKKLVLDVPLALELRRRLDRGIYHCVHAVEEAAFPAVALARRRGVSVIYDMQSSLPEQMAGHFPFRVPGVKRWLERCELWLLRNADYVVASSGLGAHVRARAPEAQVREWRFMTAAKPARPDEILRTWKSLKIPQGAPIILYTGTFERYQGLEELIGAIPAVLEHVPRAVFLLVGGPGGLGEWATPATSAWQEQKNLMVVARQPRDAMPGFLAIADVVVSARAWGGNVPLKVFDYLAAGRPIVATDIPAHRSVLSEEHAVLVPPTPAGLAEGILGLLRDPGRARGLAEAARVYAEANFGSLAFVWAVGELYEEVLGAARDKRSARAG